MGCSPQALLSMGIFQARILEWVSMPTSRRFSNPGIKLRSPTLQMDSLPSQPPGKPPIVRCSSVQFSSATQSCLTLCNPMNLSTACLPVHHQLPESTQTHVYWVSDAIQPSHSLSSPWQATRPTPLTGRNLQNTEVPQISSIRRPAV